MLIDSHCHLHDQEENFQVSDVVAHAHENQVDEMITIGTTIADSLNAQKVANEFPEIFWSFGYHPQEFDGDIARFEQELAASKYVFEDDKKLRAIGEIGLDYHYEPYNKEHQIALLERMLQLAQDQKLPVSFHVRDAFEDFWPIFDNFHLVTSVMHSFSDSEENLKEAMRRDLFVGVNGLATFAKLNLPEIDRIVFETDTPYLTPKPFRGTINKPGYVYHIAKWASEHYGLSFGEVAEITTKNAKKIFKI